jgi:hypothetical protein
MPGIHVLAIVEAKSEVDGRVKPGHDGEGLPQLEQRLRRLMRISRRSGGRKGNWRQQAPVGAP